MAVIASRESILPTEHPSPAEGDSAHLAPVATHHLALTILATIAVIFALDWAQSFVISLLLGIGILFAYTLNPLVAWLERIHVPRVPGAGIVILGTVSAWALGAYALRGQMQTVLEQLPIAANKLSAGLAGLGKDRAGTMQKVQAAANALEKATSQATGGANAPQRAGARVVVDAPGLKLGNILWVGSVNAAGLVGLENAGAWGVWGMLLSMPITVILKVVTRHVERLDPVAELLGS